MSARLICADVRAGLALLPDASVQTCVTSPPYWNLRDYNVAGQRGLEATPAEFIAALVADFREVRRVLREDATCWVNMGDSMLPNKCEAMIPHRLVFALIDDGWTCRSTIIWHKPNPMPESVTDRPTKSHEYLFLLTKRSRYYYDAEAIREPAKGPWHGTVPDGWAVNGGSHDAVSHSQRERTYKQRGHSRRHDGFNDRWDGMSRDEQMALGANKRSVWTIATQGFSGAHFATFPEALVEPCVLAGTSAVGGCAACGAPWKRVTERIGGKSIAGPKSQAKRDMGLVTAFSGYDDGSDAPRFITTGWEPTCGCDAEAVPQTCLDPFAGSGTVGVVALRHGREFVGIDLNPAYVRLAERRIFAAAPLFNRVTVEGMDLVTAPNAATAEATDADAT